MKTKLLKIITLITVLYNLNPEASLLNDSTIVKLTLKNFIEVKKEFQNYVLAGFDFEDVKSDIYPATYLNFSGPSYSVKRDQSFFQNNETALYDELLYEKTSLNYGSALTVKQNLYIGGELDIEVGMEKNEVDYSFINADENLYNIYDNTNDYQSYIDINLRQPITNFWIDNYYKKLRNAKKRYGKQEEEFKKNVNQIVLKMLNNYYSLLIKEKDLEIKKLVLEVNKLDFLFQEAKFEKGFLSEEDYYQATIELENSKSELENLLLDFRRDKESFLQELGVYENADSISFSAPDIKIKDSPDYNYLYSFLAEKGSEITSVNEQIESKEEDIKILKWRRYPEINLNLGYNWHDYEGQFSSNFSDYLDDGTVNLGLSVTFTLLDNGELSRQIQREKIILAQYKLNKEQYMLSLKRRVNNLISQLDELELSVNKSAEVLNLAEKNHRFASEKLEKGFIKKQEYLTQLINLKKSKKNYLNSKINWLEEFYTLEIMLGNDIIRKYTKNENHWKKRN